MKMLVEYITINHETDQAYVMLNGFKEHIGEIHRIEISDSKGLEITADGSFTVVESQDSFTIETREEERVSGILTIACVK